LNEVVVLGLGYYSNFPNEPIEGERYPFFFSFGSFFPYFQRSFTTPLDSNLRSRVFSINNTNLTEFNEKTYLHAVKLTEVGTAYIGSKSRYLLNESTNLIEESEFEYYFELVSEIGVIEIELNIIETLEENFPNAKYQRIDIDELYFDSLLNLFVITTTARFVETSGGDTDWARTTTIYLDTDGNVVNIYSGNPLNRNTFRIFTNYASHIQLSNSGDILISSYSKQLFIINWN
jgi:hypothetical protein